MSEPGSKPGAPPPPQVIRRIRSYAVFTTDPDGVITSWNEGVRNVLGYDEHDFVGRSASVIFTPEDRAAGVPEREMRAARENGHAEDDRWHVRADGDRVWVNGAMNVLESERDELLGYVKVMRDAGDRKRTEEQRERLASRVRSLLEAAGEGIYGIDREGRCVFVNPAAARALGYDPEELLGRNMHELVHHTRKDGSPYPEEACPIQRALWKGRGVHVDDGILWRRDGTSFPAEYSAQPMREDGEITGAVVTFSDIGDRRRAEAALRASEARQRFLADASRALASSLDYATTLGTVARLIVPDVADWCVVDLIDERGRAEMVTLTHADPGREAWGREARRRYPPDPEEGALAHVLRTGEPRLVPLLSDETLAGTARDAAHLELLRKAGMRSVLVVPLTLRERTLGAITLIRATADRPFGPADLELARELAQRAAVAVENARIHRQVQELNEHLEDRVRQRTAQLEDAMNELESFAYSVSHDLRAPLRGIDGFSQALLEDYGPALDDTAQAYLARIRAGAQRMGDLIDDLLGFSRLSRSTLHRRDVDLGEMAEQVAAALGERRGGAERPVAFVASGEDAVANGDPQLLRIALENLLENAWKFTRGAGAPRVEFGTREVDGGRAFFVRDNGAGFDPRYADKLFAPFQRLHSPGEFEGTGIGLATVQRIVHRHGGRIWAEGEVGAGATFWFTLPAPERDGASPPRP